MNNMEAIQIDGSQGEGGGQILRSSLALSLVTGKPIVIENIRAGRAKPGLMRQHLTAVNAAARIGNAAVTGAEVGSRSLTFIPQVVASGNYQFSIGTAGSATLVLQTILPALMMAGGPSQLILEGGTHNQWAPPFHFLERAFIPIINRMGPRVTATLDRCGFFPAGGGRITVTIEPAATWTGFDLCERGPCQQRSAIALISNLPRQIAQREVKTILERLNWDESCGKIEEVIAHGPGNIVFALLEYAQVTEVFSGFGRVGASAEHVANEVARDVRNYLKTDAPVGSYLADQIMLPLGISAWQTGQNAQRPGGSFRTIALTRHSTTHLEIIRKFLNVDIRVEKDAEQPTCTVRLEPVRS